MKIMKSIAKNIAKFIWKVVSTVFKVIKGVLLIIPAIMLGVRASFHIQRTLPRECTDNANEFFTHFMGIMRAYLKATKTEFGYVPAVSISFVLFKWWWDDVVDDYAKFYLKVEGES